MRVNAKRLICSIIVLLITTNSTGCKKTKKTMFDFGAYSFASFDVPNKEGYEAFLGSVLEDNGNACVSIVYTQYDSEGLVTDQFTDIVTVDEMGKPIYTLELMGDQVPCAVLENEYVFLGYDKNDVENSGISQICKGRLCL